MDEDKLIYLERAPRTPSERTPIIVLLHGRASFAKTIFSIEGLLDARAHIFALQAPFPSSLGGFEWFIPKKNEQGTEADEALMSKRLEEMAKSEELSTTTIKELMARRGLDPELLFLIGFSQGAAMTYLLSLRGKMKMRGAVPMSGFLPDEVRAWPEISTTTEFVVAHGDHDEVLPQSSSISAHEFLLSKGIKSEYKVYKGRHKMSMDIVRYVNAWILKLGELSEE